MPQRLSWQEQRRHEGFRFTLAECLAHWPISARCWPTSDCSICSWRAICAAGVNGVRRIGNGPARTFHIPGARGTVGFIAPLGDHFCATCNRMRLTADGRLRPCLLSGEEIPLREALRSGSDAGPLIEQAVWRKPRSHTLQPSTAPSQQNRMMCQRLSSG